MIREEARESNREEKKKMRERERGKKTNPVNFHLHEVIIFLNSDKTIFIESIILNIVRVKNLDSWQLAFTTANATNKESHLKVALKVLQAQAYSFIFLRWWDSEKNHTCDNYGGQGFTDKWHCR